jgi:predicted RNase H-like nuclease (RuvC/YqgF family)
MGGHYDEWMPLRLVRRSDGLWEETHAEVGCDLVPAFAAERERRSAEAVQHRLGNLRRDFEALDEALQAALARVAELERTVETLDRVNGMLGEELEEAERC